MHRNVSRFAAVAMLVGGSATACSESPGALVVNAPSPVALQSQLVPSAPQDLSGTWTGVASSGDPVSLEVANGRVARFHLVLQPGSVTSCGLTTLDVSPDVAVIDGSFSFSIEAPAGTSNQMRVSGTLEGTPASGRWHAAVFAGPCGGTDAREPRSEETSTATNDGPTHTTSGIIWIQG